MKAEFISRRRLSARLLSAAVVSFPALAAAKDWIAGDGSWTAPGNWNPSGMPGAGDIVNIVDSDGVNRVINYDYTGPLFGLGQLTLDLTNYSGTTSNILTLSNINLDLAVDSEIIGNTGSGKVVLTTGANNIANGNLYLGNGIGSVGAYSLGGAGFAVLGASANEFVGVGGTGIFNQTGGNNNISSGTLDLAQSSGSTGSYALSGTGTVTVSAEIIGDGGTGTFNQSGGTNRNFISGSMSLFNGLVLGNLGGATGSYTLSGSGTVTMSGAEVIGHNGVGIFNQSGGLNAAGTLAIANTGSGNGTYMLQGGTLSVGLITIGAGGSFIQSGGSFSFTTINQTTGLASFAALTLGIGGSGNTYNLSGGTLTGLTINVNSGGLFSATAGVLSGNTFNLTGGTAIFPSIILDSGAPAAVVNASPGAMAPVINFVSGTLAATNVYLGFTGGTSTFTQTSSLVPLAPSNLFVAFDPASTAAYTLSSGTLKVGVSENVGYLGTGTFAQTGGINTLSGGNLYVGKGSGATGLYLLSSTGSLGVTSPGSEFIGGSPSAGDTGAGIFNQSGGTNVINQGTLAIGGSALSTGTYILSGTGTIALPSSNSPEIVGLNGLGFFNQSGGMNNADHGGILIGKNVGSTGTYTLSGNGILSANNGMSVGSSGVGNFNQSGGTNSENQGLLKVGDVAGSIGNYALSGTGSLFTTSEFVGNSGTGSFVQSGGTNTLVSALELGVNPGATGSYTLSGDSSFLLSQRTEIAGVSGAGTFNQSGGSNTAPGLVLGTSSGSTGIYNLSGSGTLSITADGPYIGRFGGSAGTFNQTGGTQTANNYYLAVIAGSTGTFIVSGGTTNLSGNLVVGGTNGASGGTGVVTVNQSGQLSVAGTMKVWGAGRVNLNVPNTPVGNLSIVGNGIVNLNGALQISYGSPVNDPVTSVISYLQSGYNGGTWTGTAGIISTSITGGSPGLSLGYADGNTDSGTPAGPNQILVKYTLAGDANLDGLVNFNDLVAVVQNFNKPGTDWAEGNFLYGSSTSFNDLVAVVQNFNKILPPPSGSDIELGTTIIPLSRGIEIQPDAVRVPEPGGIGLATLACGGLLSRRRRRNSMRGKAN